MPTLYPFRFQPIFRRYVWGGRRLGTVLGKPIGPERDYAESWEVVDHGADQSLVSHGPLAGYSLHRLVQQYPEELLGKHRGWTQFPLLCKFLDAHQNLSVQVHPNDQQAHHLTPPDWGKTEAWVILDTLPGSKIYAGLKRGFDRDALAREVARGTTALCLHSFEPQVGDCVFVPAGIVHALGAGLLVAEIQQSSDTTFRLDDWNRLGADGKPRPLHIEAALQTIDYERGPIHCQIPQPTGRPESCCLVRCDKFVLERWHIEQPVVLGGDDGCHLLVILEGCLHVQRDPAACGLQRGATLLIPAASGPLQLTPQGPTTFLDTYLPDAMVDPHKAIS